MVGRPLFIFLSFWAGSGNAIEKEAPKIKRGKNVADRDRERNSGKKRSVEYCVEKVLVSLLVFSRLKKIFSFFVYLL